MKGFLIGVLATIVIVGGGAGYLYVTKYRGQTADVTVITEQPATSEAEFAAEAEPPAQAMAAAPAAAAEPPASTTPPALTASGLVLAKSDGEKPGMSVEVTELKRSSGDTITLKFTMFNNSSENADFGNNYRDPDFVVDYGSVGGVHLVDAVNKKKYLVVRASDTKNCLCSQGNANIVPGGRSNLWAKFPAPPEDVKVITVMIPHFVPMDDVPISP